MESSMLASLTWRGANSEGCGIDREDDRDEQDDPAEQRVEQGLDRSRLGDEPFHLELPDGSDRQQRHQDDDLRDECEHSSISGQEHPPNQPAG